MTNEQKEKVMLMRRQCYSYSEIADSVGVAKNTIKSFCQRNARSAAGRSSRPHEPSPDASVLHHAGSPGGIQTWGLSTGKLFTDISVSTAESLSWPMATATASTAVTPAT